MKYYPDKWVILKITSQANGTIYKILASWYGGFGGSDSWKISSGNTSGVRVLENGILEFPQYSGSTYVVHRDCYGMSSYTSGIFEQFKLAVSNLNDSSTIELLDKDFDLASVFTS